MELKGDNITDEIFIVGSRYGELADEINPLYDKEKPIDMKDITQAIGDNEVYLKPVPNDHDEYAVAVFNQEMKRIGFVWMYQAPTIRYWMETNKQGYVKVRITDVNSVANVLMAESVKPLDVPMIPRCCHNIDERWASNLPDVLRSISDQSLELGLFLLRDELSEATQWNKHLEMRIDNLLKSIPLDLSAYRHNDFMEVFNMMRKSPIKEVRDQSDWLLNTLIYRGSKEHVSWWAEEWLPSFFKEAAEGDLLRLFESAHYTLEKVEAILDCAPEHLFHLYKVNKPRFVNRLYYYALPQDIYNRLLTLLAVREAMLEKYGPEPEKDNKKEPSLPFLERLDLKDFKGDIVALKVVGNEFVKDVPLTVSDKDIKSTLEALLRQKDDDGRLLFKNKKQWWAVHRVLSTFCQYPKQMTSFKTKITDMEIDYGGNQNVITYDSLTDAPKNVPLMATCSPSAWDTYKNINDNYKQQYAVAEFLMLRLGIKS